jgi:hypothetical protein
MHNARTIHVQRLHGCSSYRGFTKEASAISIPMEMTPPTLPSWIKQSNVTTCLRVVRCDVRALGIVTDWTGVAQVCRLGLAAECSWHDVIDLEHVGTQLLLQLAILASELCTFGDKSSNRLREVK